MKYTHNHSQGMILAVLVTLLASAGWVFTKVALRELEPLGFIAWRFLLAGMVMLPFCWRELARFSRQHWLRAILLGFILGLAICIWIEGMYRIAHIGEAAFIVSLTVIITPVIASFFGQRLHRYLLLSFIPAVCGLYLLTGANGFLFESAQLLLLLSAFFFSLHLVLSTEAAVGMSALALTTVQLFVTALFAAVLSYSQGSLGQIFTESLSGLTWLMVLCSAVIATSMRFGIQTKASSLISSSEISLLFSLGPIWTASLGWLFLAEKMTTMQLWGCALIFSVQIIYRLAQNKKIPGKQLTKAVQV